MRISDFNAYRFTNNISYPIDDKNFVVAIRENSNFSDRNITPLFYRAADGNILEVDDLDVGDSIFVLNTQRDNYTQTIDNRFFLHELFKIYRGPLLVNDRHSSNPNFPKTKVYKNYLQPFETNEIFEIFHGEIDYENSRVKITDERLSELVNKRFVRSSQEIFIRYNHQIIGPFILNVSDSTGWFMAEKGILYSFGTYEFKNEDIVEFEYYGFDRFIIYERSVIDEAFRKDVDFISNKDLIAWFDQELRNKNDQFLNLERLNIVIDQIEKSSGSIDIVKSKERYDRIKGVLARSKESLLSRQGLLLAVPKLVSVKDENEKLDTQKLKLNNDILELKRKYDVLESSMNEKNEKVQEIQERIEKLKNEEKIQQEKIRNEIRNEITVLERTKEQLGIEIEAERATLEKKVDGLKDTIRYNEMRKEELETAIKTLKREFTSEQKTAMDRLSELVVQNTHFNFISGRDFPNDIEEQEKFPDFRLNGDAIPDLNSLRSGISSALKSKQRNFESHFVDNLLISLHQNTLTLFAGLPGTGKTSLAKILSSCLTQRQRIREIPVSRGWTSQKDLIGFANPLTKRFHESPTGFYELLKQLDYEWKNDAYLDAPMAYVILDEANLSPLEHYWSTFYNLTDSYASTKSPLSINLGQSEIIQFPNNLRFIGTINYDQTTEELSPRIIDRASIIRLMPNQFQVDGFALNDIVSLAVKFQDAMKIFKLNDFNDNVEMIQLTDELHNKYNLIKEIFVNRLNIYISPRVELAIKKYCQVASTIMTEESRPLDYCIAQRLLPLINIQGDKKADLQLLLRQIESFNLTDSVSAGILQKIIDVGSQNGYTHDTFNYFLTLGHV
ncbi:hypothetical protein ECE50_000320 [Chitinophaga sp. Mgbs1]|uniref:Uncharacterized protein n=1 Tax=Chitinophaga solisilvae TaxID=1233460 RepID=A0A433W8M4_9BACT|nr:hypothetical protein [Chitinophaga solisilvae]